MISKGRASVVNNALIATAGTYGETVLALVASAIIARSLGPSDFGIYTYVIFVSGWMIRLSNISLPTTVIRFVAESRGNGKLDVSERVAGILLRRQTINSVVVCLAFLALMQFYVPEVLTGQSGLVFIAICVAVFFKARYVFFVSIAKGYERFDVESIALIAVGVLTILMSALVALLQPNLSNFVIVYMGSSYFLLSVTWILLKRSAIGYYYGKVDSNYLKRIHSYRRQAVLLGLVALLGGHMIEMFLLGQYATTAQVGYFGLSIALTRGLRELCTAGLTTILMPRMAHAFGASDMRGVQRIFLESTRYYIFFGIGLGLSGYVIAEPLIRIIYGNEFLEATWVLSSLLLISGYGMAVAAVGAYLSTTDRQDLRVKFSVSVLIVQILLAVTLVPAYGLLGAVLSSAISGLFGAVLGFQWVVRHLGATIPYRVYLKLLFSGLLALGVAMLIAKATEYLLLDILAAIIFAVVYLVVSIKAGCWGKADLDLVKHLIGLLPGGIADSMLGLLARFGR